MSREAKYWTLFAVVLALVAGVGIGAILRRARPPAAAPKPAMTIAVSAPATLAAKPVQIEIAPEMTADQLLAEYVGNELGSDEKYKNKFIAVSGELERVARDMSQNAYLVFKPSNPFEIRRVQCYFAADLAPTLKSLQPGQVISVAGFGGGLSGNVLVQNCTYAIPETPAASPTLERVAFGLDASEVVRQADELGWDVLVTNRSARVLHSLRFVVFSGNGPDPIDYAIPLLGPGESKHVFVASPFSTRQQTQSAALTGRATSAQIADWQRRK